MVLDNAINGAQPQSRAFADRLCRIEGIENALRLADARAAVGELHQTSSPASGRSPRAASAGFLQRIRAFSTIWTNSETAGGRRPRLAAGQARSRSLCEFSDRTLAAHLHAALQKQPNPPWSFLPELCWAKLSRFETSSLVRCAGSRSCAPSRPGSLVRRWSDQQFLGVLHDCRQGMLISCAAPATSWPSEASFSRCTRWLCRRCSFSKLRRESSSSRISAWS